MLSEKSIRSLSLLVVFAIVASACGNTGAALGPSAGLNKGERIQRGIASWYGPGFHGKKTANGETYDMHALTAAHKTLPFNTVVRVVNTRNGQSINVRINDRGPYVGDRIIDLSKKAAEEIDMLGSGTAEVKLFLVKPGDAPVRIRAIKQELYTVQLGSYPSVAEARKRSGTIPGSVVEQRRANGEWVWRVYYGRYKTREQAERMLKNLQKQGHRGYVKQYQN